MSFRTQYEMTGWRSMLTAFVGIIFCAFALFVMLLVKESDAPKWILGLALIFAVGGGLTIIYGIYCHFKNVSYALEIVGDLIRWERADIQKEIGKVSLTNIREIVYHRASSEASDSLYAIDQNGINYRIPTEYMNGCEGLNQFLIYIRKSFPEIVVSEK
jgi:hypothetical protein